MKLLVDKLLPGNSFTKTYLFLAYCSLSLAWMAWAPEGIGTTYLKRFFILTQVLLLIGVGEQLWFTRHFGVGYFEGLAIYQNYEYAGTRLEHIHVTKAILGQWLPAVSHHFDAGVPFVRYFWRPWLLFHFWLALVNFVFLLLALAESRRMPISERAGLLLTSFILGLHTIDGGLLSPSLLVANMYWLARLWRVPYWKSGLLLGLPMLLAWLPANWTLLEFCYRFLGAFLVLALLLTTLQHRQKKWIWPFCALALSAILVALPVARNLLVPSKKRAGIAWNIMNYAAIPLKTGQKVHVVKIGELPASSLVRVVDSVQQGPYSLCSVEIMEPTSVYGLASDLGLHLQRFPVGIRPRKPGLFRVMALDPERPELGFQQIEKKLPAGSLFNFSLATLGKKDWVLKDFEFLQE